MSLLMVDMGPATKQTAVFSTSQRPTPAQGADTALAAYSDDWLIVGITNQGGVEAGAVPAGFQHREQQHTLQLFPEHERNLLLSRLCREESHPS